MRALRLAAGAATLAATLAGCGTAHTAPHRPVWSGYGSWSAGTMPLCPARDAGNAARLDDRAHTEVECTIDDRGPHGPVYVWSVQR